MDIMDWKNVVVKIKEVLMLFFGGDFMKKIDVLLGVEFSVLGDIMNFLVDSLNNMVSEIWLVLNNVFLALWEIVQGNVDLSQCMELQVLSLEEIVFVMEELIIMVQ